MFGNEIHIVVIASNAIRVDATIQKNTILKITLFMINLLGIGKCFIQEIFELIKCFKPNSIF